MMVARPQLTNGSNILLFVFCVLSLINDRWVSVSSIASRRRACPISSVALSVLSLVSMSTRCLRLVELAGIGIYDAHTEEEKEGGGTRYLFNPLEN